MRLRRHGDPEQVDKRGPRLPEWRQGYGAIFKNSEQSPRTLARRLQAFKLLSVFDAETNKWAVEQATRPNGSLNAAKLLHIAMVLTDEEE